MQIYKDMVVFSSKLFLMIARYILWTLISDMNKKCIVSATETK